MVGTCVFAGCGLTLDQWDEDGGGVDGGGVDGGGVDGGDVVGADAGDVDAASFDAGPPAADAGADAGCEDADGDGVRSCEGDCDDDDPLRYPGAPPICGDGVAQDCSEAAGDDPVCGGYGTFVSETRGDDANPGTRTEPLRTIAEGINRAQTIVSGAVLDVYVAAGTYPEDIDVLEGASLVGGFDPDTWARDPATYASVLRASRPEGTRVPSGVTGATAIDGMELTNEWSQSGSTLTIEGGAAPWIVSCKIVGPDTGGHSHAIDVNPGGVNQAGGGRATIERSSVYLGSSLAGWGANTGSYGIYVLRAPIQILDTRVVLSSDDSRQTGIQLEQTPLRAEVIGAEVTHAPGSSWSSQGIAIAGGSGRVERSFADPGGCTEYCVGIGVFGVRGEARVENSIGLGGEGAGRRASGLIVSYEGDVASYGDIVIANNLFMGARDSFYDGSAGITLEIYHPAGSAEPRRAGRFRNNIVFSGTSAPTIAFEERTNAAVAPEALEHNALWQLTGTPAVYLDDVLGAQGASASFLTSTAARNFVSDCGVDHTTLPWVQLAASSRCVDAGTTTEAPSVDFEGDARDASPDVGPDEI